MTSWPYPFWIAHRGAGKLAPENTLAAFRVGASHGFCAFECDVKLSADGVAYLLHDSTLQRTTSLQGQAGALPWARLAQADAGRWHSPAFAGELLPRLEEVAAFCLAHGAALNIELKPVPGDEARTGQRVATLAERLWDRQALKPLLSSFQPLALHTAREAALALPRALLLDTLAADWLDQARALDCVAVVMNHRLIEASVVASAHKAGLRLLAYTVNEAAEAQRLQALGINGLITDAIDQLGPGKR